MFKHSLTRRFVAIFAGFSTLIAFFYGIGMGGVTLWAEDWIFERQVEIELKRQTEHYRLFGEFDQPPRGMQLLFPEALTGHPLRTELEAMPMGIDEMEEHDLHFAKSWLDSEQQQLIYLIYSAYEQEISEQSINQLLLIILTWSVIVALAGALVGIWLGRRTAKPITQLEQRVQSLEPDAEFGETESFGSDEVGRLASSFAHQHQRSKEFLIREKRFTREVSHELRSPVAVVQGALDILAIDAQNPAALERIQRANREMQQLIDTFLLLGRQSDIPLSDEYLPARQVCQLLIERYQGESCVPIRLSAFIDPKLSVTAAVFAIVLNNLLSNAVRHTSAGAIDISLTPERLIISDSGCGFSAEQIEALGTPYLGGASNLGLGLSIVDRICQQCQWQLCILSSSAQGSQVSVEFTLH